MDTTIMTGWWNCPGCGVEAEVPLPATTSGCQLPCPDCGEAMSEQWRWDAVA